MNFFQEALAHRRSTILYGSFGRYPHTTQFYVEALPELTSASDFELIFWYRQRRLLYILLEPPFHALVPPDRWCLVLTSHVRLRWDPLSTRLVQAHFPLERPLPFPTKPLSHQEVVVPPTQHVFRLKEDVRIDFTTVQTVHEAYLGLLVVQDVLRPDSRWSLTIPESLRRALLKEMPESGPYDAHLRKVLGS